jgi:hypothetical protein
MAREDHEDLETPPRDGTYPGLLRPSLRQPKTATEELEDRAAGGARTFATGATRDVDTDKPDYEGFLSPLVIEEYGRYMHHHRHMKDGSFRDSDNWQRGIPRDAYMKSAWRHFFDWWKLHRGLTARDTLKRTLCAVIFNASGYLHEVLKADRQHDDFMRLIGGDDRHT